MGVITITIVGSPKKPTRTVDKGPDLVALYLDLYERLLASLEEVTSTTHDDFNPDDHPHAPAGQSNGGQFVSKGGGGGPTGPKPTSTVAKVAKHAIHELLSSGHPFSLSELQAITGHDNAKTLQSWITMFKSPKYAGPKGALNIHKLPNGAYQVVMPDGTPAPPAPPEVAKALKKDTPKVEPSVIKHNAEPYQPKVTVPFAPVSKEKANKSYEFQMATAQSEFIDQFEDGADPKKELLKFKNAKLLALAQWATNTSCTLHEPKVETKLFKADEKLLVELGKESPLMSDTVTKLMAQWKHDTMLEKQGKLGEAEQPKPETKELGKALSNWAESVKNEPAPAPVPYEHLVPQGFKHIGPDDFTKPKGFQSGITSLKKELLARGATAVENKKSVEAALQEHLKDKKHYQALRSAFEKTIYAKNGSLERKLIGTWASSSGDNNQLSCALQQATQDAFALPHDAITKEQLHALKDGPEDTLMKNAASYLGMELKTAEETKAFRQGLQEFIQGQYENTQKLLKDMGQEHVYVARGMKHTPPDSHFQGKGPSPVKLQPASSFSANYGTASAFAGHSGTVYLCKIPASQVLGTYLTGFGCSNEHEVVVLGHDTIKSYPVRASNGPTVVHAVGAIEQRIKESKGQ